MRLNLKNNQYPINTLALIKQEKIMLQKSKAFSGFSVDNPDKAKKFYREVLGLNVKDGEMEGLISIQIESGNFIMVYPKQNHEPATYTVLNFPVTDITKTVQELTSLGVIFEHYNTDEIKTDKQGIFHDHGMAIAWFKDPAGNIFSVIQEKK